MLRHLSTLFILFFSLSVFGQTRDYSFIPYKKNNLWGFCDSNKVILVQPIFDSIDWMKSYDWDKSLPPSKSLAIVVKNRRYGIIDNKGKTIVPFNYDDITYTSDEKFSNAILFTRGKTIDAYRPQTRKLEKTNLAIEEDVYGIIDEAKIDCEATKRELEFLAISEDSFIVRKRRWNEGPWDSLSFTALSVRHDDCLNSQFFFKLNTGWGLAELEKNHPEKMKAIVSIAPVYDSLQRFPRGYDDFIGYKKGEGWFLLYRTAASEYRYRIDANGPFDAFSDKPEYPGRVVKKDGKWGVLIDKKKPPVLLDSVEYTRYYVLHEAKLIAVYNQNRELVGYWHFNGTRYWD